MNTGDDEEEAIKGAFLSQPLNYPFANPEGKTIGDAHEAFRRVCNKTNWKYPIDATIPCTTAEAGFIAFSMNFMAGGGAEYREAGPGLFRFTHPGYYAVIGA